MSFADNALNTISQSYDKFPFIVGGVAGFVAGKVTRKVCWPFRLYATFAIA